jgi:hypothetical protein
MKLSPATIFFLLLIFLVLSALFCRWAVQDVDGFIGYRKNAEQLTEVILPMYSDKNKLTKLYDNVYFDNKSGSIVEIESPQANKPAVVTFDEKTQKTVTTTPPERVDDTGSTITALHVLPRTGNVAKSYKIEKSTDVIPAPATTTDNSYTSKVYQTNTGGVKQSVIMMPWKDTTYVHIMNNYTSPKDRNVGTFFFTPGAPALSFSYKGVQTIEITGERADTNPNNNTLVIEPLYNTKRKVYQISEYVKYDISNANLLITVDAKELIIYTRDGGAFQVLETAESTNGDEQPTVKNSAFMPRVLHDELGQNMVIYVPNGKQTLVALVCANDKQLDLRNVCRFNETGIENGKPSTASSGIGAKTASSGVEAKTASSIGAKTDSSSIGAKMTTTADIDMDNYMLKTQIIPPVCPSCPSCNFNFSGVCNQCGGNGGCGAQTINGESLLIGGNPIRDAKDSSGNILGILADTSANIIRRPGDSSGNIIRRPGDSSGNIISRPADTAAGKPADTSGNIISRPADTAAGKPADTSGNIVDKPGNAAGKQGGAAGKHGGAAGKQGGAAGKHGGAAGKQGGAAGNAAGKPGNATGRRDKFGNVINNTIDTAGNVVNRTIDTAGNVVNTTVGTVGNVATNALGVVGNILGGAGNKNQSGAGSQRGYAGAMPSQRGQYGPASAMPSQRSQYGAAGAMPSQRGQYGPASAMPSQRGQYGPASAMPSQRGQPASAGGSTNMADPYSYQGALPAKKPTDFMPLTADFSNFGR